MPLAELHVRYRAPARFGDILTVRSWMAEVKSRRATFCHEVRRAGTEEILAEGELKKIPPRVIGLLERYLETPNPKTHNPKDG